VPRKAVEAVVEATMVMEKAMSPALMIKSTGRIRSVTNITIWGILQHIAEKKSNSNNDDDSSAVATVNSVKKLQKDIKSVRKAFTTVNTQLEKLKGAESDISESEGEDEASHFQMDAALQFVQVKKEFEPRIAKLFKQAGLSVKIDLREIILLDSQSTMDLFCNSALVSKTCKSTTSMRLKSNGGTMVVTWKATMPGYNKDVWFSTRAITNIIALSNLIQKYRVTYDSDNKMFVVHRESQGKTNM
jgi:hypothetical protein